MRAGLIYLRQERPNPEEFNNYPHVFFTSGVSWDAAQYDNVHPAQYDDVEGENAIVEVQDDILRNCIVVSSKEQEVELDIDNYPKRELNLFQVRSFKKRMEH